MTTVPAHMRSLIAKTDRRRAASEVRLTPDECRCLRMAVIFGSPDTPYGPLQSAVAKLRVIEAAQS